jgi:leucine dehydrogenase
MDLLAAVRSAGHEQVLVSHDPACDYLGIIAIHDTTLGPALGGTRLWQYPSGADALRDALRLARGMTYKAAAAGINLGGGKAVVLGDPRRGDREALFRAHGRFIHTLGGRYITAEDVGTTPADMEYVRTETRHVAGLMCGSGNPSPVTAHGVLRALQAAAKHRWGTDDLKGVSVAVQGCGSTGYHLAKELHARGARLVVTDVDAARAETVAREFDASVVAPGEILDVETDIYAPCALGGVINDHSLARLKAEVVVGSANNQLAEERHGDALEELGVTYVPDYLANAGGLINGCRELLDWDVGRTMEKVRAIYDTTLVVLSLAKTEGVAAHRMADRLAESRLAAAAEEGTDV